MAALTYSALIALLQNYAQQAGGGNTADFTAAQDSFVQYGFERIYRDIVFLNDRTVVSSLSFTAGSRNLSLAPLSPTLQVVEQVAAIVPVSTGPAQGTRVPLFQTTLDFINFMWPQESMTVAPSLAGPNIYWTLRDDATIVIGPTLDNYYTAEITGIFSPPVASLTNQTTYIGTNYPSLLLAACMIEVAAWERSLPSMQASQVATPDLGSTWAAQYKELQEDAFNEEKRRRGESVAWRSYQPGIGVPVPDRR
jgi:hypothetical protein